MAGADNTAKRWNHNTYYDRLVLSAMPKGAGTALDIGTGGGLLAHALRESIPDVTGIDIDSNVLARAREQCSDITWLIGDVMQLALPESHFDLVASIATVHHLPDLTATLNRLAALTVPGGVLVVIGCARSSTLSDYTIDLLGAVQHRALPRKYGYWQHSAPVEMQFPHTYAEARRIARATLPGSEWRRLPLFRYALVWRRPA
ncbi:MAG: class I SAM-dependent methyltransferase [Micrococcaceae bacterium]|nr:class I SAM-dependent methyltransferase [Micrococcaceae bacterium]